MVDALEEIETSGLVYVTDSQPGIYRKGKPGSFYYTNKEGKQISDKVQLDRISTLVLPPAWIEVWIAPKKNAHLQATGIDAAGRKQYKYHAEWTSRRSDSKYFRFQYYTNGNEHKPIDSGMINSYIKEITGKDFTAKDFRTWGGTLEALRQLAIRGSTADTDETIMSKHSQTEMDIAHDSFITDKKQIYSNETIMSKHSQTEMDIAHDSFITDKKQIYSNEKSKKKVIVEVLDCVAKKLGNTRAVCKSSYVYPLLLEAYKNDQLGKYLKKINTDQPDTIKALENDEKILMQFLRAAKLPPKTR